MLRFAGKCNELVGIRDSRRALGNGPTVEIVKTSIPDDLEILPTFLLGVDPERVRRAHHYPVGGEKQGGLWSGFPPDRIRLDLVQFSEGTVDPLPGGE